MDRSLKWTEKASADIEAIVRFIARRDPEAAARIGFGIYSRAEELLNHPELGSLELSQPDRLWRKLIYHRWKIVYAVTDDSIIIGRVWPCALGEVDLLKPL
jgi:plasmid stabilization system protein ParE